MSKRTVLFAVLLIMFVWFSVNTSESPNNWTKETNKNSKFPHQIPKGIDSS